MFSSIVYYGLLFPHAIKLNLQFRVGAVLVIASSAVFSRISEDKYQNALALAREQLPSQHDEKDLLLAGSLKRRDATPRKIEEFLSLAML